MRLTPAEHVLIAGLRALPARDDVVASATECADRIRVRLDDDIRDEDAAVIAVIIATFVAHIAQHFPGDSAAVAEFAGLIAAEFTDPGGNPS